MTETARTPQEGDVTADHSALVVEALDELSFGQLRVANVRRCEDAYHRLDEWGVSEWQVCVIGEIGEIGHVWKDWRRGEINEREMHRQIGPEIADAVIYLDLLAARLGLDLGEEIRLKFNRTSDKVGSEITL